MMHSTNHTKTISLHNHNKICRKAENMGGQNMHPKGQKAENMGGQNMHPMAIHTKDK